MNARHKRLSVLMDEAADAGLVFWPDEGGRLHIRGPRSCRHLERELRERKTEVVALYCLGWARRRILEIQEETQRHIERSGLSVGQDTEIQAAAARCTAAGHRSDLDGVHRACAAIRERVLALTAKAAA